MSPNTMPSAAMASCAPGHRLGAGSPGLDMRRATLAASRAEPASMKTNAARLLDTLNIRYELRTYAVDPEDLSAVRVAEKVGLPAAQLFKTLVCRGDRTGVCLGVVPADRELDLKALARARGDRKCETVALKEVQPLTGHAPRGPSRGRDRARGQARLPGGARRLGPSMAGDLGVRGHPRGAAAARPVGL